MNNMYTQVLSHLNDLSKFKGSTQKLMLRDLIAKDSDDILKTVLQMALDPYRTFGVRNFEARQTITAAPDLAYFIRMMGFLEDRSFSGKLATDTLSALTMQDIPEELLLRIVRKDLRCGIGAELVNAVHPGLIRSFKVALADKYEAAEFPIFVSPKFDGLRCIVLIDDDYNVQLVSRNGNAFPALENYKDAWVSLGHRNRMFDCEVVSGTFFETLGVKKKKASAMDAVFHTFDTMTLEEFNNRNCPHTQKERLEQLRNILGLRSAKDAIQYCPHGFVANNEVVMSLYDEYRALGLEGAIMKKPNQLYAFKRSSAWTKLKDVQTFDLPVKRILEGQGQFVGNCGALVVDFRGVEVRVGTGLSVKHKTDPTKNRDWFWQKKDEIAESWDNKTPMIVEVSAHEITPDGSLRHPRLEKVRIDKTLADGEGV